MSTAVACLVASCVFQKGLLILPSSSHRLATKAAAATLSELLDRNLLPEVLKPARGLSTRGGSADVKGLGRKLDGQMRRRSRERGAGTSLGHPRLKRLDALGIGRVS